MYERRNDVWPPIKLDSVIVPSGKYVEPKYPTVRVSVVKGFYVGGQLVEPGRELSLAEPLAQDMVFAGRAVAIR
jgi:hypothetical protein